MLRYLTVQTRQIAARSARGGRGGEPTSNTPTPVAFKHPGATLCSIQARCCGRRRCGRRSPCCSAETPRVFQSAGMPAGRAPVYDRWRREVRRARGEARGHAPWEAVREMKADLDRLAIGSLNHGHNKRRGVRRNQGLGRPGMARRQRWLFYQRDYSRRRRSGAGGMLLILQLSYSGVGNQLPRGCGVGGYGSGVGGGGGGGGGSNSRGGRLRPRRARGQGRGAGRTWSRSPRPGRRSY